MTAWKIKLILAAVLAVLGVIWILQNGSVVQTRFLFLVIVLPQSVLLAITLLLGCVAGILLAVGVSGKRSPKKMAT